MIPLRRLDRSDEPGGRRAGDTARLTKDAGDAAPWKDVDALEVRIMLGTAH